MCFPTLTFIRAITTKRQEKDIFEIFFDIEQLSSVFHSFSFDFLPRTHNLQADRLTKKTFVLLHLLYQILNGLKQFSFELRPSLLIYGFARTRKKKEKRKTHTYIYIRVGPPVGRDILYIWSWLLFFNDFVVCVLVSFARDVYDNAFCLLESFRWWEIIYDKIYYAR